MKKTIAILVLCVTILCIFPTASAEGRFIHIGTNKLYNMKAELIKIDFSAGVSLPYCLFPVVFCSETSVGKIYGIYATDFENVNKCIWGMIGENLYYAYINPQIIEEKYNLENLHLIVFSQP